MKEYAQKTKQLARAIQGSGRNQKAGFVDNRLVIQKRIIDQVDNKNRVSQLLQVAGQVNNTIANRNAIRGRILALYGSAGNQPATHCADKINKGTKTSLPSANFIFTLDCRTNKNSAGNYAGNSRHATGTTGGTVTAFFTGKTDINIHAVGTHYGGAYGNTQYTIRGADGAPFNGYVGKIITFKR